MIFYYSSPLMMTVIALLMLLLLNLGNGQSDSSIRCPFRLSPSGNKGKLLELPTLPDPVTLLATDINFEIKLLFLSDPKNCLPELFLRYNSSLIYPFRSSVSSLPSEYNITFFNCSSAGQHHLKNWIQTDTGAQDMLSCPIYVANSDESVVDLDLLQCTKLTDGVLPVDASNIMLNSLPLIWWDTDLDNRCLEYETRPKSKKSTYIILAAAGGIIAGSTVLGLVVRWFFQIYHYFRMKEEDHIRVENFLKDYKAQKPTRFSYADIKRITRQFKDKLGEGAHGAVFKGELSSEIIVAVKILNKTDGDGKEFINEVGTMGKIHHVNVVRLLGFCADGFHRALVYDFFPNGSLGKFISKSNNEDTFLGWDKLHQIARGIAKGIDYLHHGCERRILHFDINPHNVLLDDNFTPKISDFGLAKLCSKNQSTVSMTAARGTLGYMAPEIFSRNFGNVSYKSDIYSFGMLLLEMVGGRKNISTSEETLQVLYPDWIHNLLEGSDLHIPIDEEGNFKIAKKLAIVGLWCIQWHPMQRPSMKTVIQMLEGEADILKMPHNPFESTTASGSASVNIVTRRLNMELEVIQELD